MQQSVHKSMREVQEQKESLEEGARPVEGRREDELVDFGSAQIAKHFELRLEAQEAALELEEQGKKVRHSDLEVEGQKRSVETLRLLRVFLPMLQRLLGSKWKMKKTPAEVDSLEE